jgi:pentose-5-phosphate-3-epimerase
MPRCAAAGADVLVAGSAIYGTADRKRRIAELRAAGEIARRVPT